ncbi:luciferin 4-monooxygenase-like isoform X1 [Lucilia sericata]|uniref:luciferin 4-monooxygenase-like isoform X1 n=1 Tax=Lucilia sericata TaxID=13632 RepID=UPI0018A874D3|nr:luciferin 4-monooxygenase-like isoform X1 [Lucilia sericata]
MFDFTVKYDEAEKIWHGAKRNQMFNENVSVGEIALFMMRSKNPQEICQISDSENITLTYGQALTTAIRLAQHFKRMQLTVDDVIGILAPNTTYVMPVVMAAWFNGNAFHAVNHVLEKDVVKRLFDITQPKIIFCHGIHYDKVKEATQRFKPIIYTIQNHLSDVKKIEDLLEPTATEQFYRAEPLKYGPNQTVAVCCSSGTTGLPKGVCLSNRLFSTEFCFSVTNGSSIMFSFAEIDWGTGLFNLICNILVGGIRIITTKPFSPQYMLQVIQKYKVNFLMTCPSQMVQVSLLPGYTQKAMSSIQLIFMTGSACSEATQKRIRSVLTTGYLLNIYGTTESGGIACNFSDYKPQSVGKIVPNIQMKIVDQFTGERLGVNELGEICVSSINKWLGYYNNPEATKQIVDSEGFTHTGDLGYIDEEHYLYLVERCKDVMKYEYFHYSPHEIEEIVMTIPGVIDVCVFGVFDEEKNDIPAAAVVKHAESRLKEKDIVKFVESKTEARYKRLHYGVYFLEEIPYNKNGKVLRHLVKDICLANRKIEIGNV